MISQIPGEVISALKGRILVGSNFISHNRMMKNYSETIQNWGKFE